MSDLINNYVKNGMVSVKPWYHDLVCGDCLHYDGEECNGAHEGSEKYNDSPACEGFDERESE